MQLVRIVAFAAVNLGIIGAWLSLPALRARTLSVRIIIALVLSVSQVIATVLILGLARTALTATNLFLISIAIVGFLFFVKAEKKPLSLLRQDLRAGFRLLSGLIADSLLAKILFALVAGAVFLLVVLGILYPPVEWDSLMYHLPPVGFYMQNQSILDPELPTILPDKSYDPAIWINSFPKNIELLFLWTTLLTGTPVLTDLVQLCFGLFGIIAVYTLAIKLGVNRHWALVSGFLFFLTPIVLAQSRSNYIDLSNSVLILIALSLLYKKDPNDHLATLTAGLSAGIVLGAKWSGILFAGCLFFFLVVQRLPARRPWRGPILPSLLRESALFLTATIAIGGYWYLKNIYLHANPLWPFRISLMGATLFPGAGPPSETMSLIVPDKLSDLNAFARLWTVWKEPLAAYDYDAQLGGLGPFWFILALPSLYYLVKWSASKRDSGLLLLFLTVAGMLLLHPNNWWTRFTLFIAGVGAVAFAAIRSAQRDPGVTRLVDILTVSTVAYSTLAGFTAFYYLPEKVASIVTDGQNRRAPGQIRPEVVSPAYDFIWRRTAGRAANISFSSGVEFTYPLWGPNQKNKVYYFRPERYDRWEKRFRGKNIKYFLARIDSPENRLANGRSKFRQVFLDGKRGYVVYQFSGSK